MKRILILLILLISSSALAGNVVMMGGGGTTTEGGSECSYPAGFTYSTGTNFDKNLSTNFTSGSFTTTSGFDAVKICGWFKQVGTAPTTDITGYLYADNGSGVPSASGIVTSTDVLAATSVAATYTQYCLAIPTTTLSSSTRYHVGFSKAYTDASNNVSWAGKDDGETTELVYYGSTNPPTTQLDPSIRMYIEVQKCN